MKTTKKNNVVVLSNSKFALEIPASKLASTQAVSDRSAAAKKAWATIRENLKSPKAQKAFTAAHVAGAKKAWITIRANRAAAAKAAKKAA